MAMDGADGCGWTQMVVLVIIKSSVRGKNTYLMHGGQPACGCLIMLEVVVVVVVIVVVVIVLWWQQLTVDV